MMGRPTVYVALQQFCETDPEPRRLLHEAGFDVQENLLGRRLKAEEMHEQLRNADAVLAGVEPYRAELLMGLPRLRCISRCGVGTDSIDLEAARQGGVAVYTTPEEVVEPVAELTIAMMLALARNLPLHLADAQQGWWAKRTGWLLSEWTIGLVGFGRIGRAVEQLLRPFSPRVLIADPHVDRANVPPSCELMELSALLPQCDLVSVHVMRPQGLGPLFGERELAAMRPGSRLVNVARGYLVDEPALHEALTSGHLGAAALDVFEIEPYDGPLMRMPQVLCTPHVGSLTRASRAAMERRAAANLIAHFSDVKVASR